MSGSENRHELEELLRIARSGCDAERRSLAGEIAGDWDAAADTLSQLLNDEQIRRWARGFLLEWLSDDDAAALSARLLEWQEDFAQDRRDRTTSDLIQYLSPETIDANLDWLSGGNAAGAVWQRLARESDDAVVSAARQVMRARDVAARETTLHLLVLDPYGPQYLNREQQNDLLRLALDDDDPEIRGLAAEVLAADLPDLLFERWETAPLDEGERVRMSFWRAALVNRLERAQDDAGALVLDESKPLEPRRSALLALGEHLPTRDVSAVLQAMLRGDNEILAEDAAQLMWRHHRRPDVASAAAESQYESVRELAERLLHPERGSPAAGGSRPGDPTRTAEIFDQISSSRDWRGPDPDEDDR